MKLKVCLISLHYKNSQVSFKVSKFQIRLVSKFMTSQPGYQRITIHILPNISRNESNQAKKFC